MMCVVVTYDVNTETIEGRRRLRQIADLCENYGQRVQLSVFECVVEHCDWLKLRRRLVESINQETDSLRFYYLGDKWQNRVEHVGAKKGYDPQGFLIA